MNAFTSVEQGWAALAWTVTWQMAALVLLAWLAERLLKLRDPRVRHALWWFALAAPLLLAPGRLALARREAVVNVPAPAPVARMVAVPAAPTALPSSLEAASAPARSRDWDRASVPDWSRAWAVRVLGAAWLLGCALMALRLVRGHRRVRRMLVESRAVEDGLALEALRALCVEAGVRGEVGLRSSDLVAAPVLYGLRRPVILVPEDWLASLAPDELRALLAHEVAHVRRRDVLANLAQRLIEIPLFFHPGAWLASRRITQAREELCDAWALRQGGDPAVYARSLAAAAERAYAGVAAASLGVAESRFTLLKRVEAIMDARRVKRLSRPLAVALAALLAISAAALAAVTITGPKIPLDSPAITSGPAHYTGDLDGQLEEIAREVREQLVVKRVSSGQAEGAARRFADSLRGALKEPLREDQFNAVLRSLQRMHFALIAPYPDITDLEIEWCTLVWTDVITQYVKRAPMIPAHARLLRKQVESLVATFQAALDESLDPSERREIPGFLKYLRQLLDRGLDDPVQPVLKRPFTETEMADLRGWVSREVPNQVKMWRSSPRRRHDPATVIISPIINDLVLRRIETAQYTAPTLSPDRMKQLWAERKARIRAESKWEDERDERELAAERARDAEQRRGWEAANAVILHTATGLPAGAARIVGRHAAWQMAYFTYDVPFGHQATLLIQQYRSGKPARLLTHVTTGPLRPGRQSNLLFLTEGHDGIVFSWAHSSDDWATSGTTTTNAAVPLKGYPHDGYSGPLDGQRLTLGDNKPIIALIADHESRPSATLDFRDETYRVITEHDMVVIVFIRLERVGKP